MEVEIGRGKKARRAYGFDEIAIVPSRRTRDPDDIDITWKIGDYRFELPLLASAMDGVVSPATSRRRKTRYAPRSAGTAYSAQTHAEWAIGAQSVGVRSSPCQFWNCSVSR